jgi:uncharacterized membrane protein YfcA
MTSARHSRDGSFRVLRESQSCVGTIAIGSLVGGAIGASLLGVAPGTLLLPALALILVASAWKLWQHR